MNDLFYDFGQKSPVNSIKKPAALQRFRAIFGTMLVGAILLQNTLFGSVIAFTNDRSKKDVKAPAAPQAAFTSGNLAVLQIATASANNTTGSIVEVNPTAGGSVQTLPIDGGTMRFSGSATSTGYLANSNDGSLVAFNAANSATTSGNSNTILTRAAGVFNNAGTFSLAATYTSTSGQQPRSATSINNTAWFIGDQNGIYTNGATTASPSGNLRAVKSFGGTVYAGTAAGTPSGQVSVVSAPTGGTLTPLPGLATNSSHQDFYLISSGENGAAFDVLYVLSATSNTVGTITKFSLVAGIWTANGSYATTFGGFGIAAADSGTGALLYVSTGQGALAANNVLRLNDTAGHNAAINITAAPTTLYTAPAGATVKGVAFAPSAGVPTAPEIDVTGNGVSIADGDAEPSPADFTDFGNSLFGSSVDRSFIIRNTGTAQLTGGAITFTGLNSGDFTVQSPPTFPVAAGDQTSFTVRFTATLPGQRFATVNIASNDSNENPYDFAIQGNSLTSATPTMVESSPTQEVIDLPANGPAVLSGVVGDGSDPVQTSGIGFTIADADNDPASLTFTATSSNQAVVPNANLITSGAGASRFLRILPSATGYTTITVSADDGQSSASYVINYAASTSATANFTIWHTGKADASTVIPTGANHMFVADDEDQTIRLYNRNASGAPIAAFNFTSNLALTDLDGGVPREVDIEASAQVGNRIYWLASHSNAASGNQRVNRSRLFATDVTGSGATATLSYVGRFDNLKANLIAWDNANGHGLGAGALGFQASTATGVIPETEDGSGFNIEGLVMAPDDTTGYIAFRAPISPAASRTNGLVIPVTNFTALVAGNPTATTATFGAPIFMNLGGRGIREIRKNASNEYLIVAGPAGSIGNFRFFSWTGNPAQSPIGRTGSLAGLNPESIVDVPAGLNSFTLAPVPVQIVSDNGDDVYYNDGIIAKELPNNQHKKFRSDIVTVGLEVTAASVSIRGRVFNNDQRPLSKARVTVTYSNGEQHTLLTNQFGQYEFTDVPVGNVVVFEIEAKGYTFTPQVMMVTEELPELNFTAFP